VDRPALPLAILKGGLDSTKEESYHFEKRERTRKQVRQHRKVAETKRVVQQALGDAARYDQPQTKKYVSVAKAEVVPVKG
jgi:hypothetical protein